MFLTPAIAVRQTNYWIDDPAPGDDDDLTRGLPIGSLDMGMTFERETTRGRRAWMQTLEPRLLYVRTPYRQQSQLPNYDAAAKDFNFVSIYTDNQFSGVDRVSVFHTHPGVLPRPTRHAAPTRTR